MGQQSLDHHLLPFLFTMMIISLNISCCSRASQVLLEDNLLLRSYGRTAHDHEISHHGYGSRAYDPSYFMSSTINVDVEFEGSIDEITHDAQSLKCFDHRVPDSIATSAKTVINVKDFGAQGDGIYDDTEPFKNAWEVACSSFKGVVVLVVPAHKKYRLKPIKFSGPCKSDLTMQPCKNAPTAITFYQCTNLIMKNLKIQNAQQIHVSFQKCMNVRVSYLIVTSPEKSPNTDGIHVTRTQNIHISSCVIRTGDDCISIVSGSQNVRATDITCGPGHGISIGSLGSGNSEAHVSEIFVNRAKLSGTTNGVRIKTWQDSAVQVKNVIYENIHGTSASDVAIKFDCSKSFPCRGVLLQNVNLESGGGKIAKALCRNVQLADTGIVSPRCP